MEAWKEEMYYGELYHHGIKGMKWGVRRYQNEDGTLTSAGRRRYRSDYDINDTSKLSIAKIRTGEARRNYDTAKLNNPNNRGEIRKLKKRVRAAEKNEKLIKGIEKGEDRIARGETITGNNIKTAVANGAAYLGTRAAAELLNARLNTLQREGRRTHQHDVVAAVSLIGAGLAMHGAAGAYTVKKNFDNDSIRKYYSRSMSGGYSKQAVGSKEYQQRVERETGKASSSSPSSPTSAKKSSSSTKKDYRNSVGYKLASGPMGQIGLKAGQAYQRRKKRRMG